MTIEKIVIIGGGPAGISIAIQLKRYGIEAILLEKEEIGGLLRNANLIENYLGFPKGISGLELTKLFKKQLVNAKVKFYFEEVLEVDYKNNIFIIKTNKRILKSNILIIASGTKPHKLAENVRKNIFYEIHKLSNITNKKIVIIGAGDVAFDYALNLSKKNDIIILNRGEKVKCIPLLWERASKSEKIIYYENREVKEIQFYNDELILICSNLKNEYKIIAKYLIIAIGREPQVDFLSENIKKNIEILENSKLLYMIGDVKNDIYRQIAISIGDGIKVAMELGIRNRHG